VSVITVEEVTGYPSILGGRVKTLHPKILGGILARQIAEHEQELAQHLISRIDLVVVDLYPVWDAAANPDSTILQVMELTDIGGVTLLRAAAKNHTDGVVVVYDVADRQAVVAELAERGSLSLESRRRLAAKVFKLITLYDGAIWKFLSGQEQPAGPLRLAEQALHPHHRAHHHDGDGDRGDQRPGAGIHQVVVVVGFGVGVGHAEVS